VGQRASLEAEREAIGRVLRLTGWNRKQAAGMLGVSYKTLLAKIKETGLAPEGE
jgi:DNA-binding NtrC family response regulator